MKYVLLKMEDRKVSSSQTYYYKVKAYKTINSKKYYAQYYSSTAP